MLLINLNSGQGLMILIDWVGAEPVSRLQSSVSAVVILELVLVMSCFRFRMALDGLIHVF